MNTNELLRAIGKTSHAMTEHQAKFSKAAHTLHDQLIPQEPYLYIMPLVAFLIGLRYAKPCAALLSVPNLRTYGLFLLPLLKE